jgi:hypothetical protein
VLLIVPAEADHVTATLAVFATVAANCIVPDEVTVVTAGLTVTAIAAGVATVITKGCVPFMPAESVACTTKVETPVFPGVPEMVPVAWLRARPEGKVPDATLKT